MRLQTITTIELSSRCNMACRYCVNRRFAEYGRSPAVMSARVFNAAVNILSELESRGTQREVWLNGNGESTLDPDLVSRIEAVMRIVPAERVGLCSNGEAVTPALAKSLVGAGLQRLDLSPHNPYYARRAVDICLDAGLPVLVNPGAIVRGHNWAGQLEEKHRVKIRYRLACEPLAEGRGYIDSEGRVTPCCYDFRGLGAFATVFDLDIFGQEIWPFELCETCHQNLKPEKPGKD